MGRTLSAGKVTTSTTKPAQGNSTLLLDGARATHGSMKALNKFYLVDTYTRSPHRGCKIAVIIDKVPFPTGTEGVLLKAIPCDDAVTVHFDPATMISTLNACHSLETAALAAAHILYNEGFAGHGLTLRLGVATVTKRADHLAPEYAAVPLVPVPASPSRLYETAGVSAVYRANNALFAEVDTLARLDAFVPDAAFFAESSVTRLVIMTRTQSTFSNFATRAFTRSGFTLADAPVSATDYAALALFWLERLTLPIAQGEHRGSKVGVVTVERGSTPSTVVLPGQSVTIAKGILSVPLVPA